MWIDTRDCVPIADGYYLTQTVFGELYGFNYTVEAGWNTSYRNGRLCADSAIDPTYVARWYALEAEPDEVPKEWEEEHLRVFRKGV